MASLIKSRLIFLISLLFLSNLVWSIGQVSDLAVKKANIILKKCQIEKSHLIINKYKLPAFKSLNLYKAAWVQIYQGQASSSINSTNEQINWKWDNEIWSDEKVALNRECDYTHKLFKNLDSEVIDDIYLPLSLNYADQIKEDRYALRRYVINEILTEPSQVNLKLADSILKYKTKDTMEKCEIKLIRQLISSDTSILTQFCNSDDDLLWLVGSLLADNLLSKGQLKSALVYLNQASTSYVSVLKTYKISPNQDFINALSYRKALIFSYFPASSDMFLRESVRLIEQDSKLNIVYKSLLNQRICSWVDRHHKEFIWKTLDQVFVSKNKGGQVIAQACDKEIISKSLANKLFVIFNQKLKQNNDPKSYLRNAMYFSFFNLKNLSYNLKLLAKYKEKYPRYYQLTVSRSFNKAWKQNPKIERGVLQLFSTLKIWNKKDYKKFSAFKKNQMVKDHSFFKIDKSKKIQTIQLSLIKRLPPLNLPPVIGINFYNLFRDSIKRSL